MSFCRITGCSRGLPKPNYFPLLPPISPVEARRCCRITSKSAGLPTHHYIPVILVNNSKKKPLCHITSNVEGGGAHHFVPDFPKTSKERHVVMSDYRYVFPVLDGDSEGHKKLSALLASKTSVPEEVSQYVYTVQERRCSLVFSAQLESAIRDGDVSDVMLAEDSDTLLLKLRHGTSVSVGVNEMAVEEEAVLFDGEGPREEVVQEREKKEAAAKKRKRKRTEGLNSMKKIFEEKERAAVIEEDKVTEIYERKKARVVELKLSSKVEATVEEEKKVEEVVEEVEEVVNNDWLSFKKAHTRNESLVMCSGDWRDLVKPLIESWDWDTFEREAAASLGVPLVTHLPGPISASVEFIAPSTATVGVLQDPDVAVDVGAFEAVTAVAPFAPLVDKPDAEVQHALRTIDKRRLSVTENVKKIFQAEDNASHLPTICEVQELVSKMGEGVHAEFGEVAGQKVHGLMLDIAAAKRFVPGQTVETPSGKVFVPGQTLQTPSGAAFVPGVTVMTPDGPLLMPGQAVTTQPEGKEKLSVFVAGQTMPTVDGEAFVAGQTFHSAEGARFVEGQTVFTKEGPKFVAGQVVGEEGGHKFVPGQTVMTADGHQFVPGQTVTTPQGDSLFVPGQSVQRDASWDFVPGQSLKDDNGEAKFVPGKTMMTDEGPKFVPGQTVRSDVDGEQLFVPGITVDNADGTKKFVAGKTMQTPEGPKFMEGQLIKTGSGTIFTPGKSIVGDDGKVTFAAAKSIDDVIYHKATPTGLPIDPNTTSALPESQTPEAVFGNMIQSSNGVEFFPKSASRLPPGKLVPGKLSRGPHGDMLFVPGILDEDDHFVPGQVVMTETGEQFIPGQVVATRDGPKFVPGQVVETKTGPKFVPGQTVTSSDGSRFVPGQIVETKVGPTFIPGQVISTETEGSRFVPGQVVDTAEGPRFVPGRVVESDERVTFIPGQVVETAEGLRFVAPDLQDTPGGAEFSVQGFEVTPEELRLLRPTAARSPAFGGEMAIDSRMMRQLSDAGMSLGKQLPGELPAVRTSAAVPAFKVALRLTESLGLKETMAAKMGEVLSIVARLGSDALDLKGNRARPKARANKHEYTNGHQDSDELHELLRAVVSAVVATASQKISSEENHGRRDVVLQAIGSVFNGVLADVVELHPETRDSAAESLVNSLYDFLRVPSNLEDLCENAVSEMEAARCMNKMDTLRDLLEERDEDVFMERLSTVLQNDESTLHQDTMGSAFTHLSRGNPQLVKAVIQKVSENATEVVSEREAIETLQNAIVSVVRADSEMRLKEMIAESGAERDLKTLLLQAVGLARALGMSEVAADLLEVLSDQRSTHLLSGDRLCMDILRRLTVMRQLADERPNFHGALHQLQSDPELARNNPRLRELVRESAALMVVPEEAPPLQSSVDIPNALFFSDNSLAMEEFFFRTPWRRPGALLILKHGLQAVIPREAARGVLTGNTAYTVLDEKGIRHFEPLHVFSALRLPRPATHRFSMYYCPVAEEEEEPLTTATGATSLGTMTPGSSLSMEDLPSEVSRTRSSTRLNGDSSRWGGSTLTSSNSGKSLYDEHPLLRKNYNWEARRSIGRTPSYSDIRSRPDRTREYANYNSNRFRNMNISDCERNIMTKYMTKYSKKNF